MYAVIGNFSMEPSKMELHRKTLGERIIPMVRELAGFVAGYWSYDHATSTSQSYSVWETEAQAKKLVDIVMSHVKHEPEAGVAIQMLSVAEIWGQARG